MSYNKKSNYESGYGGGGGGYKKNWNNEGSEGGNYKKSWNNNRNGGGGRDYNNSNDQSNGGGYYIDKVGNRNGGGNGKYNDRGYGGRDYNNNDRNGGGRDYNNNDRNGGGRYNDRNGGGGRDYNNNYDRNGSSSGGRGGGRGGRFNNNDRNGDRNSENNRRSNKQEDEEFIVEDATNPSAPQLDLDTRSYFTRIESLINKQEEAVDQEEIDIMIENAYKEIEGKESLVACDKKTSLVLESMFQKCKDTKVIVKFFESFGKEFEKLIHDANGSRVIEGLLRSTPKIVNRSDKETLNKFNEILFQLCDLLLKDILKTVTDRYASYVFSSIILILSGTIKEKKLPNGGDQPGQGNGGGKKKPYKERMLELEQQEKPESNEYPVSKEFTDKLKEILDKIKDPIKSNMVKYSTQKEPIETIKSIFQVLSNAPIEIYRSWLEAFIKMSNVEFSKKQLIKAMKNQFGSVFCEIIVKTAPEIIFLELIQLCKHDLMDLSEDFYANHVIQQMIDHCHCEGHFLTLVQEFKDNFKQLFKMGRGLIVQKLIEQSLKWSTYEKEIIKHLNESILPNYKTDQKDIAKHLLALEGNVSHNQMYSACGAVILQLLFKFSNDFNKNAIESFLSLDIEYLLSLATNVIGSKVLDGFLDSTNVPLPKKNQLILKFNGNFVTIGEDRYGSYSIEKMYKIADFKQKDVIAVELMKEEERLFARPCGRYVLMICQINKYKKKKDSWANDVNSKDKKRKLFSDLLNDNENQNDTTSSSSSSSSSNKKSNKKSDEKVDQDFQEENQENQENDEKPKKKSKKSNDKHDEIDDIFNSKSSSKNKKK
ncbi:hypothetical protein ACTA71_004758 [Dictyostelium dimigraforme]